MQRQSPRLVQLTDFWDGVMGKPKNKNVFIYASASESHVENLRVSLTFNDRLLVVP